MQEDQKSKQNNDSETNEVWSTLQTCTVIGYSGFLLVKLFPVFFADMVSSGNPYTKINKIESIHALDLTGVGVAAIFALLYLQFRKR